MSSSSHIPHSVLVIDEDEVIHNLVGNQLQIMGVEKVDFFSNGPAAWKSLLHKTYDFLFFDWKLSTLPGVTLLNRLKGLGNYRNTPILISSSVHYKKDFGLLEEFPGTALIEKPFTNRGFEKKVRDLFEEVLWYEQNEKHIRELIKKVKNDGKTALKILYKLIDGAPHPEPLSILGGKELISQGFLEEAEELFRDLVKKNEENHLAWNELGRIFKIRDLMNEAAQYFGKAHKISPKNLSRLGDMAEIEMLRKDSSRAKAFFREMLEIDPKSPRAAAGVVAATHLEEYFNLENSQKKEGGFTNSFASLMNLSAISMVNGGKIPEAVEQYKAALELVEDPSEKARLVFNLGLAYLKWGRREEALSSFEKAADFKIRGFQRPEKYIKKIHAMLK